MSEVGCIQINKFHTKTLHNKAERGFRYIIFLLFFLSKYDILKEVFNGICEVLFY